MTVPVIPIDLPPRLDSPRCTQMNISGSANMPCGRARVSECTWFLGATLQLNLRVALCLLLCQRWCNYKNAASRTHNYQICLRRSAGLRAAGSF